MLRFILLFFLRLRFLLVFVVFFLLFLMGSVVYGIVKIDIAWIFSPVSYFKLQ